MRLPATFLLCLCLCLPLSFAIGTQATDNRLQRAVDSAMQRAQGSVVVLDVETGRLRAAHRIDAAARRLARPGSTIKPFTLLALMDAGVVGSGTTLLCRKSVRLSGRTLDCSHTEIPEPLDGFQALAYSCNYFFIHMTERLSADTLTRSFREAGLDSRSGILSSEAAGLLQTPSTREGLQLMAIGEESLQVTPLGLSSAYRKLALRMRKGDARVKPVVDALTSAVRFGTGQLARVEGLAIAGKTGTSPASDRLRTYAWFAGFAPADRPEIALVVFLEQGSGGGDAAPIAQKIFAALR